LLPFDYSAKREVTFKLGLSQQSDVFRREVRELEPIGADDVCPHRLLGAIRASVMTA
jgi:hypothetical protein